MPPSRRRFLAQALAGAGLLSLSPLPALAASTLVSNVSGLYPVEVARILAPTSTRQVVQAVRDWPGRIAVGGARYSMGGQTAIRGGLHLDMRGMNRLIWLDPAKKRARVQAGMRWRDLQDALDPLGLAVHTMQSFANFTVGGAVSVNAHGRYLGNGPVVNSVRALQLVLADGSVVEATRSQHAELFRAAAGGYGAIGVITEVELELASNTRIERSVEEMTLDAYPGHFARLSQGGDCIFHNADLLPPHFDTPVSVSWRTSRKPLTEPARLVPKGQSYALEQNALFAMTELPHGELLRSELIHPLLLARPAVKWRNHEASLDAAALEPRTRRWSTYVLQEYFIPVRHFADYARAMAQVIRSHRAQVLNVSVRHSPADRLSLLPWAKEEVFSFVVYYKQRTHAAAQRAAGDWTRAMIDTALPFGGRYYLPYQLHATRAQFEQAYPEVAALRSLKRRVDPAGRFANALWAAYL
ncbi:FAD-binding oxidoreductase [Massilia oculi]|uniref:FAD-binding oxidoreductase n=1 Tax=Massilia hydrophila TaxID=3044279 RepID=A0ABS7YB88_9BURK|nr:FAD-binding oxidoreductase [Massilia oculi]MCA1856663.1 FAD-binding oxidoreductase [Massilia oculi]